MSPTPAASTTSRPAPSTSRPFCARTTAIALVDPTLNAPCLDANGTPLNRFSSPALCGLFGYGANPAFNPVLLPYDFTRGGTFYHWHGQTDVKQLALYVQDQITAGRWLFNVGIRGDLYNGLAIQRQAQPRVGLSYTTPFTRDRPARLLRSRA